MGAKRSVSDSAISNSPTSTLSPEERDLHNRLEDVRIVDKEFSEYENEGLLGGADLPATATQEERARQLAELENFDILRYWEVRHCMITLEIDLIIH